MLLSVVIHLEAAEAGTLPAATGQAVHGFWFRHWMRVDPRAADALHNERATQPFTLSPLMGLARPQRGQIAVAPGTRAWVRVTTLSAELSAGLEARWLPGLPQELAIGGMRWRFAGAGTDPAAEPWAGRVAPDALVEQRLLSPDPPYAWRLSFVTPTAFHGDSGHLPFPLPAALVHSWLRRWQAFGTVSLPKDLPERARRGVAISAYALRTAPVRDRNRVTIGCVGWLDLQATALTAAERAPIDLLAAFAFYAGSGHHTTQGMGMTVIEARS